MRLSQASSELQQRIQQLGSKLKRIDRDLAIEFVGVMKDFGREAYMREHMATMPDKRPYQRIFHPQVPKKTTI